MLAISGEQGSAKTVLSKMLKALVDPNVAPVRALPREERELMIAANNGYVLAFDNVSGLPAWLAEFDVEQYFALANSEIARINQRFRRDCPPPPSGWCFYA